MAYSLGKVTYVFVFPLYLCSSRSLCFRCIPALVLYIRLYLGYFSFKLNSYTTSFMKHFVIIFLSLKIDMTTLIKNKTDLLYCAHSTHSLWKLCVLVFFFFFDGYGRKVRDTNSFIFLVFVCPLAEQFHLCCRYSE